jgi:hypothetical protein
MFPNCPLPEEGITSFSPYLIGLSQWSKLSSKIWDNMFSVKAERPASEELISSLDAEILYGVSQLPPSLWWDPMALREENREGFPFFARRQMCLLHLVYI